jgi:uncharacterized membrane protein
VLRHCSPAKLSAAGLSLSKSWVQHVKLQARSSRTTINSSTLIIDVPSLLKSGLEHTSTFDDRDHPPDATGWDDRASDWITGLYGSWVAFWGQAGLLTIWAIVNTWFVLHIPHFDPYPFTFLNLFLSSEAAFSTTFVLMSQNRAAKRDRALLEMVTQSMMRTEAQMESIEVAFTAILANQQKQLQQQRTIVSQNQALLEKLDVR